MNSLQVFNKFKIKFRFPIQFLFEIYTKTLSHADLNTVFSYLHTDSALCDCINSKYLKMYKIQLWNFFKTIMTVQFHEIFMRHCCITFYELYK